MIPHQEAINQLPEDYHSSPELQAFDINMMLSVILHMMRLRITRDFLRSTRTSHGNTQFSERIFIRMVRETLTQLGLYFEEAGTQQPYDFRNIGGVGLQIEVKRTNSRSIIFNDTLPTRGTYYLVAVCLEEPHLVMIPGEKFTEGYEDVIDTFVTRLNQLRDDFARGPNRHALGPIMGVYPRPTFRADIRTFLNDNTLLS